MSKQELTAADPLTDPLGLHIRESMMGVERLRSDNVRLYERVAECEREVAMLNTENQLLRQSLESERAERRHYHSLANEIITRLDVVAGTIDDVVKRAQQEVYRQRKEHPREEPSALINVPEFLRKLNGDEPKTERADG